MRPDASARASDWCSSPTFPRPFASPGHAEHTAVYHEFAIDGITGHYLPMASRV